MATVPEGAEPGSEPDVSKQPSERDDGSKSEQYVEMERVQEDAAEERKKGGYQ